MDAGDSTENSLHVKNAGVIHKSYLSRMTIMARQRSLLEFGNVKLNVCPCCLGLTKRDPADIIHEAEREREVKEMEKRAKAFKRNQIKYEKDRKFQETRILEQRQSEKTGKWLDSYEWVPKIMLETSWKIPEHIYLRIVDRFVFDKDVGLDTMRFKFRTVTGLDGKTTIIMNTPWDLLVASFMSKEDFIAKYGFDWEKEEYQKSW